MSVLVWECQEGLLEQRPSSCGSPVPGGRKGSPGKGRGLGTLLGRDSRLLVTLTVTLTVTNHSELNSQSPAGGPDAEKHGQLCGLGKDPGACGSDRV